MSVNITIESLPTLKETVATQLQIYRNLNPQTLDGDYSVMLRYATHYYSVDSDNKPLGIVAVSQDPSGCITLQGQEMEFFFNTPLKNVDGSDTTLGIVLARLMDERIDKALIPVDPCPPCPAAIPVVVNS